MTHCGGVWEVAREKKGTGEKKSSWCRRRGILHMWIE